MDAPAAPAAHTPGRRQRLATVAENIRPGVPHVGQPMQGCTKFVQLFRTVRVRHTGRFRSQTVASGGTPLYSSSKRVIIITTALMSIITFSRGNAKKRDLRE